MALSKDQVQFDADKNGKLEGSEMNEYTAFIIA